MSDSENEVRIVDLRPTVQVALPDGRVLEARRGTPIGTFLQAVQDTRTPIVGAIVNGLLRELTFSIEIDARVIPVTMGDPDGMRIYRRSLTFLLAAAFEALFPGRRLNVDHSVASGGYYCEPVGGENLSSADLKRLEKQMRIWVEQDLPFNKSQIPIEDAIQFFEQKGFEDKARLLRHRRKPYLVMYQLDEHQDYFHGYMLPRTGYLKWFALQPMDSGFTLRFPRRHQPTNLLDPPRYPKMLATFRQYGDWLEKLGISSVGALNDAIVAGRSRELILVSEALHEHRIADIAAQIPAGDGDVRVILIAGPSSSGKTTFSKRLSVQLIALGLSPFPLELDRYFVDREKTPLDRKGEFDFESLHALDLPRLNHDLRKLIAGEKVRLPHYDFLEGIQKESDIVQLQREQIMILEGIHGLNPELVTEIPEAQTFRIYASALTQLNLDRYNRVSTTDTRLIRRIVRDAAQRGYSAVETIRRWESVRRGEKANIFPYQENADVMFNSALVYEGSALAQLAEPLLRQVSYGTVEHVEAKRLLSFLEWFLPLDTALIPDNSILREFVGGSILRDFVPWQPPH